MRTLLATFLVLATATAARAVPWLDATGGAIGTTAEWSNKVELADVDGDGLVDILFANGGNYSSAGTPEATRIFKNLGDSTFTEVTDDLLAQPDNLARAVKVRDVNGDGEPDLFIGNTYQTQSRLLVGDGDGLTDVTATALPAMLLSVGDLELGDVDGDGDLDAVLADWGAGDPLTNGGGVTRLWLNDGDGVFTDATAAQMPDREIGFSWDLELVDVDNDFDLDLLVSCKSCTGSALYRNDGAGSFADASAELPQFANNYDFEAMDLDGDEILDLVTINDGLGGREHVFIGDGTGYADATAELWPDSENPAVDDNVVVFLDADSDGDADFLIGSLGGEERLLENDGSGHLTLVAPIRDGTATDGTLGLAVADLDGDERIDLVEAQGEASFADKVYFGSVDQPADTAAPVIAPVEEAALEPGDDLVVRARVHDRKTPVMEHDFARVALVWSVNGGPDEEVAMSWYGEALWRGRAETGAIDGDTLVVRVCADDAAGNQACSADQTIEVGGANGDGGPGPDGGEPADDGDGGGCGCQGAGGGAGGAGLVALVLLAAAFRSGGRRSARRRNRRRPARA